MMNVEGGSGVNEDIRQVEKEVERMWRECKTQWIRWKGRIGHMSMMKEEGGGGVYEDVRPVEQQVEEMWRECKMRWKRWKRRVWHMSMMRVEGERQGREGSGAASGEDVKRM